MDRLPNKLYIVGNGFDLFHGIQSSYHHFEEYVRVSDHRLYEKTANFYYPHDLWSDFEASLGLLSREIAFKTAEIGMPDLKKDFEDLQMSAILLSGDFIGGELDSLFHDLKIAFHHWVRTLKIPAGHPGKILMLDNKGLFLSFNYTGILQSLYSISPYRINYIHGYHTEVNGSLIIGHNEGADISYADWKNRIKSRYDRVYVSKKGKRYRKRDLLYDAYFNEEFYHPAVEIAVERIEEYFGATVKDTSEIIRENELYFTHDLRDREHIFVLGHSLSDVDAPYLKEIIVKNKNPHQVKWFVTYHSSDIKERLRDNLLKLEVSSDQIEMIPWSDLNLK